MVALIQSLTATFFLFFAVFFLIVGAQIDIGSQIVATAAPLAEGRSVFLRLSDLLVFANFSLVGKNFLHIHACLGACLEKGKTELLGQGFALLSSDYLFVLQVCLICYQDFLNIRLGVLLNLSHPVSDIIE